MFLGGNGDDWLPGGKERRSPFRNHYKYIRVVVWASAMDGLEAVLKAFSTPAAVGYRTVTASKP